MKVDRMPNLLAIDTSTDICSLAISANNKIYSLNNKSKEKKNNQVILDDLGKLLNQSNIKLSELDAVVLSAGPGSFTGLRVATSVAQSIAYANNIKVIRLSSLQVIAEFLRNNDFLLKKDEKVYIAQDARKNEIYFAEYSKQDINNFSYQKEKLLTAETVKEIILKDSNFNNAYYLGNAFDLFEELKDLVDKYALKHRKVFFPDVQYCFTLATEYYNKNQFVDPHEALPIYIRNNIVG